MSNSELETLSGYTGQPASLSRRLGAVLLDALALLIPSMLLGSFNAIWVNFIVWVLYAPILESSPLRATIGKKLMGIQVVTLRGERVDFKYALLRTALKIASTAFVFIPWAVAFFTAKKQAVHDLISDTVVVYGRADLPVIETYVETVRELWSSAPKPGASNDKLSKLERLQALYERGALSQAEFEREKANILNDEKLG